MKMPWATLFLAFLASAAQGLDFTAQGEYVGSSDCRACHERFYKLWSTSHHGLAMQAFSAAFTTNLVPMKKPMRIGDSRFLVKFTPRGGELIQWKPDGTRTNYPILHAMGGRNVYFFLVPLDRGKLQVAPLAYYVHSNLWYDATASMVRHFRTGPADAPLDWTDRQLTFNTACHDCHVSQLRKNYDPKTDTYHTTWKEAGINCETCHGPAEAHVKAAEAAKARGEKLPEDKLAIVRFHKDLDARQRDATCSPCHAKMVPLTRDFTPGELFFDHYDLISYENRDFYPDGRDHGENYTLTGWMANPCARSGKLECIHCHTSSGRFRFRDDPNKSCLPCHKDKVEHFAAHARHPASAGLTCISCHMPKTAQAYMTRSDHSFRPPAPQASLEFGSPNACVICHFPDHDPMWANTVHTNRADLEWAAKAFREKGFGTNWQERILRAGRVVDACRKGEWKKLPQILAFLDDPACDLPTRVAIVRLLAACPDPEKWPAVRKQMTFDHPWVRSAAATTLQYDPSPEATRLLLNACRDRFRIVRIRAANALVGRDLSGASKVDIEAFRKAHDEYWKSLVIWPDRWSTHYNQGVYFDRIGETKKALAAYEKAMKMRGDMIQPIINASIDYARLGDTTNALRVLQKGLKAHPDNPLVHLNLALLQVELGRRADAEQHLRAALKADPHLAQAAYNLGVLLCQNGKLEEGLKFLRQAAVEEPSDWHYASAAVYYLGQEGRTRELESLLKEVVASGRAAPEAYFFLVSLYRQDGRRNEALEILRKAKFDKHLPADARSYAARLERELSAGGQ